MKSLFRLTVFSIVHLLVMFPLTSFFFTLLNESADVAVMVGVLGLICEILYTIFVMPKLIFSIL